MLNYKIPVLAIKIKSSGEVIHVEPLLFEGEYESDNIKIPMHLLTDLEIQEFSFYRQNASWDYYKYREEVRHLLNWNFENITFEKDFAIYSTIKD